MKIVKRAEYLEFIAKLDSGIEEGAQDGEVAGVIQSVDPSGEVRAQVMYFKHAAPQFMIGVRTAWQPGKKKLRSHEDAGHFVDPTTGVAADTTAPSKAELHAAIAEVVALPGSAYTAWRQRLRRTLAKRPGHRTVS